MSDLSLMVKAGVQWGLFGGAIENLGTERHHKAYVQRIIDLDLLGCFAMTETGHGSDVQALETTATYDPATQEFVIDSPTRTARKDYIGGAAKTARVAAVFAQLITTRTAKRTTACTVSWCRSATTGQRPAGRDHLGLPLQGWAARCRQRPHPVRPRPRPPGEPAEQVRRRRRGRHLQLADRESGPPVLHHAGHADPRPGDSGRQRGAAARVALDIATRYALQRRQFSAPGDDNEVLLMDYLVHQRRLFPLIARSYALQFAQNELVAKTHELQTADNPMSRSSASWSPAPRA